MTLAVVKPIKSSTPQDDYSRRRTFFSQSTSHGGGAGQTLEVKIRVG